MKRRTLLWVVLILVFSFIALQIIRNTKKEKAPSDTISEQSTLSDSTLGFSSNSPSDTAEPNLSADPWEVWIEKQADIQLEVLLDEIKKTMPFAYADAKKSSEHLRAQIIESLKLMKSKLQEDSNVPPPLKTYKTEDLPTPPKDENSGLKIHNGPQTPEVIMETFKGMLDPNLARDEKYPESEWLQMLLNRGISVQDTRDYFGYQHARFNLLLLEQQPEMWESGMHGIEPTTEWEIYKTKYINRMIWEYEVQRAAEQADPTITDGFFVGDNADQFLPLGNGRVYVRRGKGTAVFRGAPLTDEQKFNIMFKGENPEGYTIIYLDRDNNILNEPPPPVTREELMPPENWGQPSWDDEPTGQELTDSPDIFPQNTNTESPRDPTQHTGDAADAARNEFEKMQQEIIETLTIDDIDTMLEKGFTRNLPFNENIETQLREQFNPNEFSDDRINSALETINRYGPEEGLRRLSKSDPKIAAQIQQKLQAVRNQYPNRRNASTKSPQE